jgi:hypothetical protein
VVYDFAFFRGLTVNTLIPSSIDLAGDPALVARAGRGRVKARRRDRGRRRAAGPARPAARAELFPPAAAALGQRIETDPVTFFMHRDDRAGRRQHRLVLSQAGGCVIGGYLDPPVARVFPATSARRAAAGVPAPGAGNRCDGGYSV